MYIFIEKFSNICYTVIQVYIEQLMMKNVLTNNNEGSNLIT